MLIDQLKGQHRRLFLKTQIDELSRTYRDSQKRLLKRLQRAEITDFQRDRTKVLLAQIEEEIDGLNRKARTWAKKTTKAAYEEGTDAARHWLGKQGQDMPEVNLGNTMHTRAIAGIVDDTTVDLVQANLSMKLNLRRYIRTTQQSILEDKEISRKIAQGLVEGSTRRETSKALLADFKKNLGEGNVISIKGRNYRPDHYARMVARTRTREATTFGTYKATIDYGMDLIQISIHANPADICKKFHGRVFSISGNHPDFPPVEGLPPYHPNCKHVVLPVTEEALQEDGTYNEIKKFSNTYDSKDVDDWESFEKKIQTPQPKYKAPAEKKVEKKIGTREHLSNSWDREVQTDQIMRDLNVDHDTAEDYRRAISVYTGDNYGAIRKAQSSGSAYLEELARSGGKDPHHEKLVRYGQLIDDYVEKAPSFEGTVFRGIDIPDTPLKGRMLKLKAGDIMDMHGASSWTSNIDVANEFAMGMEDPGNLRVIIQADKTIRKGASVTHLTDMADEEEEVLVSSRARFKITNSEVFQDEEESTLVLKVEEV